MGGGFAGTWMMMFYLISSLNARIDKVEIGLNAKIDKLSERVDRLSDKIENLNNRVSHIEGSLTTQGHCLFNQSHKEKRAE